MVTAQVEYVGFRSGEASREYRLLVRHPDGHYEEFTLAIAQEAFLSRRVRYQDGAEICFMKLSRALAAWASAPEAGPLAAHQKVTEADLLQYREDHTPKPRTRTTPPPTPSRAA
jgi:hypothetical protein